VQWPAIGHDDKISEYETELWKVIPLFVNHDFYTANLSDQQRAGRNGSACPTQQVCQEISTSDVLQDIRVQNFQFIPPESFFKDGPSLLKFFRTYTGCANFDFLTIDNAINAPYDNNGLWRPTRDLSVYKVVLGAQTLLFVRAGGYVQVTGRVDVKTHGPDLPPAPGPGDTSIWRNGQWSYVFQMNPKNCTVMKRFGSDTNIKGLYKSAKDRDRVFPIARLSEPIIVRNKVYWLDSVLNGGASQLFVVLALTEIDQRNGRIEGTFVTGTKF